MNKMTIMHALKVPVQISQGNVLIQSMQGIK